MTTVYKGNKTSFCISSADTFIEMYLVTQSCELLNYVLLEARSGRCFHFFESIAGKVFLFTPLHTLSIFLGQFGIVLYSLKWQTLSCLAALSLNSDAHEDRNSIQEQDFLFKLNGVVPCLGRQYSSLDWQRPLAGYRCTCHESPGLL